MSLGVGVQVLVTGCAVDAVTLLETATGQTLGTCKALGWSRRHGDSWEGNPSSRNLESSTEWTALPSRTNPFADFVLGQTKFASDTFDLVFFIVDCSKSLEETASLLQSMTMNHEKLYVFIAQTESLDSEHALIQFRIRLGQILNKLFPGNAFDLILIPRVSTCPAYKDPAVKELRLAVDKILLDSHQQKSAMAFKRIHQQLTDRIDEILVEEKELEIRIGRNLIVETMCWTLYGLACLTFILAIFLKIWSILAIPFLCGGAAETLWYVLFQPVDEKLDLIKSTSWQNWKNEIKSKLKQLEAGDVVGFFNQTTHIYLQD